MFISNACSLLNLAFQGITLRYSFEKSSSVDVSSVITVRNFVVDRFSDHLARKLVDRHGCSGQTPDEKGGEWA